MGCYFIGERKRKMLNAKEDVIGPRPVLNALTIWIQWREPIAKPIYGLGFLVWNLMNVLLYLKWDCISFASCMFPICLSMTKLMEKCCTLAMDAVHKTHKKKKKKVAWNFSPLRETSGITTDATRFKTDTAENYRNSFSRTKKKKEKRSAGYIWTALRWYFMQQKNLG